MNVLAALTKGCTGRVRQNEPLSAHTSFRIGGPADYFLWAENSEDVKMALDTAASDGCPLMVIGNGTNLLMDDEGFRGIVVRLNGEFNTLGCHDTYVRAGAGVSLSALLDFCVRSGLGGLEFAAGIPGTVGGSLYTNAKTRSGWIRDRLAQATTLGPDKRTSTIDPAFPPEGFSPQEGQIIVEAAFQLTPAGEEDIRSEIDRYLARRRETQPLSEPSAGCIFTNPEDQPAGRLIDQCGCKGMRVGGALVSDKHANFIINTGGARSEDVLELIERVKERVFTETGVALSLEIDVIDSFGERMRR